MVRTVDNFELFSKKLFEKPLKEDEFYFLQILVRGKDGHHVSGNNKNRLIKYYTITSAEQMLSLKDEILAICHVDNARAYIHPTKRSFKEVANIAVELAVHTYVSQNWIGFRSMYSTACGQSFIKGDKKFIVDLDDIHEGDAILDEIRNKIYTYRGHGGENSDKVFMTVPTKSGVHLVTWPFDIGQFEKDFPGIDIHKNNPTLLYFRWETEGDPIGPRGRKGDVPEDIRNEADEYVKNIPAPYDKDDVATAYEDGILSVLKELEKE